MDKTFTEKITRVRELLAGAEYVLVGGGAGLSAAAGLTYAGARFTDNFADFIARYGMRDMYSAGFYPFASQEEKWAYWSRHILLNRFTDAGIALYKRLLRIVKSKNYFVITTNVDCRFQASGFDPQRIFAVQGDYGKLQCAKGCHDRLYDDEETIRRMAAEQKNCRVPAALVPKCPVCGGDMEINIRKDDRFVQDAAWYAAAARYEAFVAQADGRKVFLLELGVGYNTPSIIRFPYEQMTYRNKNATLVRVNKDYPEATAENAARTLSFDDIAVFVDGVTP